MKQLVTPTGPAPRKKSITQYFMQHNDHKKEVDDAFAKLRPNIAKKKWLAEQDKVAKQLFLEKEESLRETLIKENDDAHALALIEHKQALKGLPPLDPEQQALYVVDFFDYTPKD